VLDERGTHALLTLHRRANAWFQLGGHLEPGDASLRDAARREAREESGLGVLEMLPRPVQLDRHLLVGAFGRCREHLDVRYAAVAPGGATPRVGSESHDVRWWPVGDLPPGTRDELTPLVSLARADLGLG
jgi:8-oxo-dGTP pyrophosphatase MutT (NUDIX family)